jgi:oligopeptidase B
VYAGAYDPLSSENEEEDKEDKDKDDLVEDGEHPNHSMPSLRQAENDTNKLLDPPVAIADPYGALRDDTRTDAFVLDHLRKENEYTDAITAHLAPLRESLYQEMLQAIQETDYSTPAMDGPFWYYTRTFEGKAYTVHCRAPATITSSSDITDKSNVLHAPTITWDGSPDTSILTQEEIYLDENVLAANKSYCSTGSVTTSPNHTLLAYTVDFTGNERFQLHVQDVDTGRVLMADESLDCSGHVLWGHDEKTLVYLALDEVHRPYRVYRRRLLEPNTEQPNSYCTYQDDLLFEEKDDLFATSISKTADKRYLLIHTSSTETSEIYYLDLTDPNSTLECVASRNKGVLYDVEHWEGYWLVTTNIGKTPNMRLMVSPVESECALKWKDVSWVDENGSITKLFDGGYSRALDGIDSFRHYAAAHGREGGIPRIWLLHIDQSNSVDSQQQHGFSVKSFQSLEFPESAYDVAFGENYEYNTSQVTIAYDSLITPPSSLLIDMKDPNNRMVLKERNVRGYVKGDFGCERRTVLSRDGKTEIPISIVYRNDIMEKHISSGEPIPVHLYGYGSYGICMEADFRSTRLPLLNRGMVYVIAHVRGGGEMGRNWYEEPEGAKYLCKQNTFNDFIDVGHWLVHEKKMTTPPMLSCEGRSAGGLLIGASINQRPDLFGAAILGVPFLDVVCTMVDSSIPLTCGEW